MQARFLVAWPILLSAACGGHFTSAPGLRDDTTDEDAARTRPDSGGGDGHIQQDGDGPYTIPDSAVMSDHLERAGDGASDAVVDAGVLDRIHPDGPTPSDATAPVDASTDAAVSPVDASTDAAVSPADAADAGLEDHAVGVNASRAVAYQINTAHTGEQPDDTPRLPLARRWSHDFAAGGVSYPLVADGRVFVTVGNSGSYGSSLFALDLATGNVVWGPVLLGGTYFWSNAAYENGRIFTVNFDGKMSAFDAATGSPGWSVQLPGQYAFSSPPTALGGVVYVGGAGSGGTVYAVNETNGAVLWTAPVANGDHSSPAVSAAGVYVSYACNQAYGFAPSTGALLWHHTSGCGGGGGKTVALIGNSVYTRDFDGNLILSASGGVQTGSFTSSTIPAASKGVLYTLVSGKVVAQPVGAASPSWTAGDGTVVTAPLVVGGYVVFGSSTGLLSVASAANGTEVSSDAVGANMLGPDEQNVSRPLTGLAAASDRIIVPAGTRLVAY